MIFYFFSIKAACIIFSSLASACVNFPVSFDSDKTKILSDIANISGSSEETTIISIPSNIDLKTKSINIENSNITCLEGKAILTKHPEWKHQLYREIPSEENTPITIRLIPYYAWGNWGHSEMTVWLPLSR